MYSSNKIFPLILSLLLMGLFFQCKQKLTRVVTDFNANWYFHLNDIEGAEHPNFNASQWRNLNLPHDWSIEGEFSENHPATVGGGALPGGTGWYRKSFKINEDENGKRIFIEFDGIYMNSEVWINGKYLGIRPNGYISFSYELTPYLNYGTEQNVIAVKVDNSKQPNSRWYSGSGIYRNVRLVITNEVYVPQWGTFITTPQVTKDEAFVKIQTNVKNASDQSVKIDLSTRLIDSQGKEVGLNTIQQELSSKEIIVDQEIRVINPKLWSVSDPHLYKAITQISHNGSMLDEYETTFGIRYFEFDAEKGFLLNGESLKILGVCNHHDLGSLGAAINTRAIERQLEIMREMGVNAIRTAHNPPAPELLQLCDRMGFIVMDEVFDMWKKQKSPFDYGMYWDEWHEKDLEDFIRRDRNHPSIFMWSIGNEILEQWDSIGIDLTKHLVKRVKALDTTRPVTAACNPPSPENNLIKPDVLDLIGYNYAHTSYEHFPEVFPGKLFIATETTSALATRGHYDMPSDSIRRWPIRWDLPFTQGNEDHTVSAYDHVSTPWGSTHAETWRIIKKHDYLSGMFIWTGFDYLGEPTPYGWPSRSSYFGVVDLAGFPKDAYYMYQSEWTDKNVLHVFPHWNWNEGDTVDVWAYFNQEEVELFLNGKSMGTKTKAADEFHVMWRLDFEPGTLRAVGKTNGQEVMVKEIHTAGSPAKIKLTADRTNLEADGKDLAFITVEILDEKGNIVPLADNLIEFEIEGEAFIASVDNGDPTSHEPFKASYRRAFNGKCLAIVQTGYKPETVNFTATSEGLESATVTLEINK